MCVHLAPGCTDSRAENYEPAYNVALDGSCSIAGCMDCTNHTTNCTVDAAATFDVGCLCGGTCARSSRRLTEAASTTAECWDPTATNYNPGASGGTECAYARLGCTDSLATNYLPLYTADDGKCEVPVYGCTIAAGMINYDSLASALGTPIPCVAVLLGCTDSQSSTHAAAANTEDGSCAYDVFGCMLAGALNFDSTATVDQGCVLPIVGCMTVGAKNYAEDANVAAGL